MRYILLFFILSCSYIQIIHADDVYLQTGYVYKNVRVIDTLETWLRIKSISDTTFLRLTDVAKIEIKEWDTRQEKTFELYSPGQKVMYDESMHQLRIKNDKSRNDSLAQFKVRMSTLFPTYNSFYIGIASGYPKAGWIEAGYTDSDFASIGLCYAGMDKWAPNAEIGVCATLYIKNILTKITPYVYTAASSGFVNASIGFVIPLNQNLVFRQSIGIDYSSRTFDGQPNPDETRTTFSFITGFMMPIR